MTWPCPDPRTDVRHVAKPSGARHALSIVWRVYLVLAFGSGALLFLLLGLDRFSGGASAFGGRAVPWLGILALVLAVSSCGALLMKRSKQGPDRLRFGTIFLSVIWPCYAIFVYDLCVGVLPEGDRGSGPLPTPWLSLWTLSVPLSLGLAFWWRARGKPPAHWAFLLGWGALTSLWVLTRCTPMLHLLLSEVLLRPAEDRTFLEALSHLVRGLPKALLFGGFFLMILSPVLTVASLGCFLVRDAKLHSAWPRVLVGGAVALLSLDVAFRIEDPILYDWDDVVQSVRGDGDIAQRYESFVSHVDGATHRHWLYTRKITQVSRTGGFGIRRREAWRMGPAPAWRREGIAGLGLVGGTGWADLALIRRFAERRFGPGWELGGGVDSELRVGSSELEVRANPGSAIAVVHWRLRIDGSAHSPREWRTDIHTPSGTAVHDLWLSDGDQRREAAVSPRGDATRAYERVRTGGRDPALLTKEREGCYHLRVFPVTVGMSQFVELRFVVPMRHHEVSGEPELELRLPRLGVGNAILAADFSHQVRCRQVMPLGVAAGEGADSVEIEIEVEIPPVPAFGAEGAGTLRFATSSRPVAQQARGTSGYVLQTWQRASNTSALRASRWIVLLDAAPAFASIGRDPRALLGGFSANQDVCILANGLELRETSGLPTDPALDRFLRCVDFAGGHDTLAGLEQAARYLRADPLARLLWFRAGGPTRALGHVDGHGLDALHGRCAIWSARPTSPDSLDDVLGACHVYRFARGGEPGLELRSFLTGRASSSYERILEVRSEPAADVEFGTSSLWLLHAAARADLLHGVDHLAEETAIARQFGIVTFGNAAVVLERDVRHRELRVPLLRQNKKTGDRRARPAGADPRTMPRWGWFAMGGR